MAAAFDPYSAPPDTTSQTEALMRAYQQGLINLSAKKGQYLAGQGLLNTPDYNTAGGIGDFSSLQVDPNQQFGGYRNELQTEANMLDAAENGPDRGFSGGLANQAARTARQAVGARQTAYQQNMQQTLGNFNLDAGNQLFNYQQGVRGVDQNAKEYAAQSALWQATNPTAAPTSYVVPGASGGGSTPLSPQAVQTAASLGYQTVAKPTNLKPVTFKPTASAYSARGGHAT